MKTAFVLSGGGAKGAFQVGAMDALIAKGIKPDAIYGTSVGALNAFGVGFAGIEETTRLWLAIKGNEDILGSNFWSFMFGAKFATPGKLEGWYSLSPLRKKLLKIAEQYRTSSCEVVVCYTDLLDGSLNYAYGKNPEQLIPYVEASSAVPFVMNPVKIKDLNGVTHYLVDGGLREQTPLKFAIDDGADEIYAILCNPYIQNPQETFIDAGPIPMITLGLRAIDVLQHEVFVNDIANCRLKNTIPEKRNISLKIISPEHTLIETLQFNPDKIRLAIEQGKNAVK